MTSFSTRRMSGVRVPIAHLHATQPVSRRGRWAFNGAPACCWVSKRQRFLAVGPIIVNKKPESAQVELRKGVEKYQESNEEVVAPVGRVEVRIPELRGLQLQLLAVARQRARVFNREE